MVSPCVSAQTIAIYWNNIALEEIRKFHPGPPQVARILAMTHTCMYDAWTAYDSVAVGVVRPEGNWRRPAKERTNANKNKAISYAAYHCLLDLVPRERLLLDSRMKALGYDPEMELTDVNTPEGIGNVAARAVIQACHHDGSNQLGDLEAGAYEDYTDYAPVNGPDRISNPDRWQPLRVIDHGELMIQRFVAPFWGRVRPFALTAPDEFRPGPPYSYEKNREDYILQARELVDLSAHLSNRQKMIAEYWADGPSSETPPGHWCLFAQFVSARDHHDIDSDVKMFFALTNALFDASIAAWDAKRAYDSVRPITAIHLLFSGQKIQAWAGPYQGKKEIDGSEWKPYQEKDLVTPAFPEYVSGHSVFSGAAAEVLRQFTRSDVFGMSAPCQAGSSRIEPHATPTQDVTLSWSTFTDAANEAGISRRYGGIHFRLGDVNGRQMGRSVGAQSYAKAKALWQAQVSPMR